jgi:hypothetical protein
VETASAVPPDTERRLRVDIEYFLASLAAVVSTGSGAPTAAKAQAPPSRPGILRQRALRVC